MGIGDLIKLIAGGKSEPALQEAVGAIAERPTVLEDDGSGSKVIAFHLDTRPDLEFRQTLSALSTEHKRGDRIKVSYRLDGAGVAKVEWVEAA